MSPLSQQDFTVLDLRSAADEAVDESLNGPLVPPVIPAVTRYSIDGTPRPTAPRTRVGSPARAKQLDFLPSAPAPVPTLEQHWTGPRTAAAAAYDLALENDAANAVDESSDTAMSRTGKKKSKRVVQDEARQVAQCEAFGLRSGKRNGDDSYIVFSAETLAALGAPAHLQQDTRCALELKTHVATYTANGSRKTVAFGSARDTGLHGLAKARGKHWVFSIWDELENGEEGLAATYYCSPAVLEPWFNRWAQHVWSNEDAVLPAITDSYLTGRIDAAFPFHPRGTPYTLEQVKVLYPLVKAKRADLPGARFSRAAFIAAYRERCVFLITRGAGENNPKFSLKEIIENGAVRIDTAENPALALRQAMLDAVLLGETVLPTDTPDMLALAQPELPPADEETLQQSFL